MKNMRILLVPAIMFFGLFLANTAFAQSVTTKNNTNKETLTVSKEAGTVSANKQSETTTTDATKHECKPGCTMACCASKTVGTSGKTCTKGAKASGKTCSHGSKTSATSTSTDAKHACAPGCQKACCAAKTRSATTDSEL